MGTSDLRLVVGCSHIIKCVFRETASIYPSKWLMLTLLRKSATFTIGMARANSTCSTLATSCTPWDSTSPRRSACKMANKKKRPKKFASFDEVVTMVNAALKTPENHGNYHDYIELCKLYDKNENGTMMLAELENIL